MRKVLMTAAAILALGVASPAFADGYNGYNGTAGHRHGQAPQAPVFQHGAKFDRDGDRWERGWQSYRFDMRIGFHNLLTRAKLKLRLQQQGFYHVQDLRPARFGNWRATAMYRGRFVALRVDQFSGRVIAMRYV
jgi:hypothetical protein